MNDTARKLITAGIGAAWTMFSLPAANAQDVEIFTGAFDPSETGRPNILLILDDSGSMGAQILTQNTYDPTIVYDGGTCNADENRVYWSIAGGPPACDTTNYVAATALVCQRALDALNAPLGGSYQDHFAQYDDVDLNRWGRLSSDYHSRLVECEDDLPDPAIDWPGHGDGINASAVYPQDGDQNNLWTADENSPSRIAWNAFPTDLVYAVFSGNYLNWYYGEATLSTRLRIMQDVAINLINSMSGVNIGVMHFSSGEGGVVAHAISEVESSRSSLGAAVNDLTAGGSTPLSETLYEAYLYLSGDPVRYGAGGDTDAFVPMSDPARYESPIDRSCQRNHIVLLTDGEPTNDTGADASILSLVDAEDESFADLVGSSCDIESYPAGFNPSGGECLDELAEFMQVGDIATRAGQQNVTTHTVGFTVNLPILEQTAERGGGEYRTATDTATLTRAFSDIVLSILETQSTFTAPSVSINSFNQARNTNDIYVGLFEPTDTVHWPGNLKKFRLRASDTTIVDANGLPIVDPATGIFGSYVQDFWSSTEDGGDVMAGGAANHIPASRNVYTFLGDSSLTSTSNRIDTSNLTNAMLGTGDPGLPSAQDVVDFINGIDVADVDHDGDVTEPRMQMGDPLHSGPVVVVYGPDDDQSLVFMGTNDGMLHAFNANDGSEAWAFLPPEFLMQQVRLLMDGGTGTKTYGVDGSIRVQTIADNDGVIDESDGERVLLFFGMRRGGDAYYALDVTDPDSPEVLWSKDSGDLDGLGQSWSSVTPTRINVSGVTQNEYKLALVIGGGYDPSQDAATTSTDSSGNSIYIVDTLSGDLLWRGTADGGDQDFSTSDWSMDYSIPADVRTLDLNGDGFADRLYAADMGGQIWRFDIANGNPASSLVTGGVIAQLGAAGQTSPGVEDTRRFYYAPDIAVVTAGVNNFIHIGIGSGHRAHPNSTVNHDEFYALRDHATFAPLTQSEYNNLTPIRTDDLVDVTDIVSPSVAPDSAGWRLSLNDGGWQGEKVLAETRTFASKVFVTTYRPNSDPAGCSPGLGTTRQYVMSLYNAAPVTNLDSSVDDTNGDGVVDDRDLQLTDRYREYQGPPPPETVFFFPPPEADLDGDGVADDELILACAAEGDCLGEIICQGLACTEGGEQRLPVRTFWLQEDID